MQHPVGNLPISPKHDSLRVGDFVQVDDTTVAQYMGLSGVVVRCHNGTSITSVQLDTPDKCISGPVRFLRRELRLIARAGGGLAE